MPKAPSVETPYRNKKEARIGGQLQAAGVPFAYEGSRLRYVQERSYLPDFWLKRDVIIEYKGWFKSGDRSKLLLVKEQHPHLDIRLLFQRAHNKLSKKSKTTYAEWCDKHGFKWAEGVVPDAWIKELK